MKVLLINPTNSIHLNSDFVVNIYQPLGLVYVAAALEKAKYKVKIIDALAEGYDEIRVKGNRKVIGMDYEEIKKRIRKFKPDVIGIGTPFSYQAEEAHQMAALAKEVDKKIVVIAGGSHTTIQPMDMLDDRNFDYIIRGEGEESIIEFLQALETNKGWDKVRGLSYKDKKGIVVNVPIGLPIQKLDSLAFPAIHLLPLEKYHEAAKKGRVIEGLLAFGEKRSSLFTSRGCPHNCTFCSVHLTMTRMWRGRSPENVLQEIRQAVKKFDIKYFDVLDDNFTLDPERAKQICRMIIDEKIKIKWSTPNGVRADKLDEELIILMKKAGCLQIKVAPESGSQEVLTKIIRKAMDLEQIKRAVGWCKKHGLSVEAFFIIGFPEETIANIHQTIDYAKELRKLGCDYCYFFIATPYFGTEMYIEAIKKGYLDESKYNLNEILTTDGQVLLTSPNFTKEELLHLQKLGQQVNPPITKTRFWSGLKMLTVDPMRIIRYAGFYANNFIQK